MKKYTYIVILIFFITGNWHNLQAQEDSADKGEVSELEPDSPVIKALDSVISLECFKRSGFEFDSTKLNHLNLPNDSQPPLDDEVIEQRLAFLDGNTPFDLTYNNRVKAFINLYANKKPGLTERVLGLSAFYFPLFEETLAKHDLPLEFKYLAVVESALNATARSRAGAVGLWQFIYSTGKLYDLDISSYKDERMDPIKSTEAACRYFEFLHSVYGDWNLVLAAYNCGPGNVNKAIRRSGYQRDYWDIYRYLPRETRGYVPAFIAVNYIMNYSSEHNLYPIKPDYTYFDFDTLVIKKRLTLEQVAASLDINLEKLEFLNPAYKRNIIPFDGEPHVLRLPREKIGLFVVNEKKIYGYDKPYEYTDTEGRKYVWQEQEHIHRVRSGEFLGKIATNYGVSVSNLMEWNNMRSTTIHPGNNLMIYKRKKMYVKEEDSANTGEQLVQADEKSGQEEVKKETAPETPGNLKKSENFIYYQVQEGDTLWDIAIEKGIPVSRLRELNKNLNARSLKPGERIIIGTSG